MSDKLTEALVEYFSLVIQKARHDKGGPGSGNWAHAGRPGSRGGSQSGGGLKKIGAKPGTSQHDRRAISQRKRGVGGAGIKASEGATEARKRAAEAAGAKRKEDEGTKLVKVTLGGKQVSEKVVRKRSVAVQKEIGQEQRKYRPPQAAYKRLDNANERLAQARRFELQLKPKYSRQETFQRAAEVIDAVDAQGVGALGFGRDWK